MVGFFFSPSPFCSRSTHKAGTSVSASLKQAMLGDMGKRSSKRFQLSEAQLPQAMTQQEVDEPSKPAPDE